MGKLDNDEEENVSFIVYYVPGCSLHTCDCEKKIPRAELLLSF